MPGSPYPMLRNRVNWNYIGVDQKDRGVLAVARHYGLPASVVNQRPFMLSDECRTFGGGRRVVDRNSMLEKWCWLWESPLYGPYVLCICSSPDVSMARTAAARLFMRAIDLYEDLSPVWHNVLGYRDSLLGGDRDCSLLVLNGVTDASGTMKKDALFDLLSRYESIPRIIVTSARDPMRFMGLLRHEFHHAMNLGSIPVEEELDYANG